MYRAEVVTLPVVWEQTPEGLFRGDRMRRSEDAAFGVTREELDDAIEIVRMVPDDA